jgi:predicted Zn-dependent protease
MRMLAFIGLVVITTSVLAADTSPRREVIAILNGQALESNAMEQVRTFVQQELNVPVVAINLPAIACTSLDAAIPDVLKLKQPQYACIIALVSPASNIVLHATFRTNVQVAVVNATAMRSNDPGKTALRIGKQIMRGAGFLFGLPPSLDPFCVMRDYDDINDFDQLGRNFFPPWQFRFQEAVRNRGIAFADAESAPTGAPN